ncbi:type II toxin-antitoxin system VapC family toxin [Acidithiobacillus sp. CV18-2]|nr:type II toxin-antitoxin system VapC family toxin [Acidithiobacillus sp. CV18-3]MBU2758091.1 type II toxin-antitoxin system VapC family toxin [Acidithiobacillus sp. BN09-2]MBU2776921.1 type II toxin-antitoxin system VapC family toxin [Acidithiobacillus sp. CV18-2]MBU2800101.1 type II toxin-antitoxin system VapC family toxin [Acidithiobacillus sp. VAN18-4]
MNWVIDASVALKWFLRFRAEEDHVSQAIALLEQTLSGAGEAIQPPHFTAEMAAVLARVKPDTAREDMEDLWRLDFRVVEGPELYILAIDLSRRYEHHLFDTLYHALALLHPEAMLVTADRRYFIKAQKEGSIMLLENFSV